MASERKPLYITIQNNYQFELPTTASAGGVDLNTGRNLYYNTSSLAWVPQETFSGSSATLGDITGSNLRLTGNPGTIVNEVGPLTISSSVGITASQGVSVSITDALTSGTSSIASFVHDAGTGAAGIAADITFRTSNAGSVITDAAALGGTLTTATNGAEVSSIDFKTRSAGGALRRTVRFYGSGGIGLGTQTNLVDPGNSGIVMSTTNGLYINSGGTNYQAVGTYGGSNMIFGSGAFNVTIASFALSISAGQGTFVNNGFLSIAAAAGFRRVPAVVNNINKTVALTENMINMTNLSAARTVTLPTATSGAIVRVLNGDGSAGPTKYVVVTGSSNARINGINTTGHVSVVQPYASTEYWSDGAGWSIIGTSPKSTNESPIDFAIARNTVNPTEYAGDYTIGIKFSVATGSVSTGFRFYWSGSAPKDFEAKIWSGSIAITSVSFGLTGANYYTGTWTTPIELKRYNSYFLSYREKTGTNYYATTVTDFADFQVQSGTSSPVRIGQQGLIIYSNPYSSASGDVVPVPNSIGTTVALIEPTVFF